MNEISFLIGSGFSVPAGVSSSEEINKTITNTKKEQFYYDQDKSAGYLFGRAYVNNEHEHIEERRFVEEFINFYNKEIIGNKNLFDYEKFYDFFVEVYRNKNINSKLENFLVDFNERNSRGEDIPLDYYLYDLGCIFPQLVKSMVWKDFSNMRLSPNASGCYPANSDYGSFLNLIIHLREEYIIQIHSLNHDLLMESFRDTYAFKGKLDDGFTTNGSNVYGELDLTRGNSAPGTYYVRLPVFADRYKSNTRLYKLQGSVDRYRLHYEDQQRIIKILSMVSPGRIFLEQQTEQGPTYFGTENRRFRQTPDFLTGTQRKRKIEDIYYSKMLDHLEQNLKNSNTLIIIGYGFGDRTVNDYLEDFAQDVNKKLIVVDRKTPEIPFNIICQNEFLNGGVSGFDLKKLLSLFEIS